MENKKYEITEAKCSERIGVLRNRMVYLQVRLEKKDFSEKARHFMEEEVGAISWAIPLLEFWVKRVGHD